MKFNMSFQYKQRKKLHIYTYFIHTNEKDPQLYIYYIDTNEKVHIYTYYMHTYGNLYIYIPSWKVSHIDRVKQKSKTYNFPVTSNRNIK